MVKFTKRRLMLALAAGIGIVTPLAVVACGSTAIRITPEIKAVTTNGVFSTYYNTTDMMLALGYMPDMMSLAWDKTIYSDYLKGILGDANSYSQENSIVTLQKGSYKIVAGPQIDRNQVNGEFVAGYELQSILMNEWHKKASDQNLTGSAKNLIYTTMADSDSGRDTTATAVWGAQMWRMNLFKCFEFMVKPLKLAYPEQASKIQQRFDTIKLETEARYSAFNTYLDNLTDADKKLRGKSIIFFDPEKGSYTNTSPLPNKIRSDTLYQPFYGTDPKEGLGMVLPRPKGLGENEKASKKKVDELFKANIGEDSAFALVAKDIDTMISTFEGKSDYVVVLKNPQINASAGYEESARQKALSMQKNKDASKVLVLNMDLWYDTMWGPLGINILLDQIREQFAPEAVLPSYTVPEKFDFLR